MVFTPRVLGCPVAGVILFICACKPPEPTPSHYGDLGTDQSPLLPPPPAWHDPATAKGTAEWRPFRKLSDAEPKTATAKTPSTAKPSGATEDVEDKAGSGESEEAEKEIRGTVADFNAALAEKKFDEATEFLTDDQAEKSGEVFAAVQELIEQLRLLQAASPALTDKINALLPALDLSESMKIEVQSIQLVDAKKASAKLGGGGEARFEVGEKDLWYLESPMLNVLVKERSRIEKTTKDIPDALAKGSPDEATITALGNSLDELRTALSAPAQTGEGGGV